MMNLMQTRDARSLDHRTLEEMRRLAVKRVLHGEPQAQVARSLEVHPHSVWRWIEAFRKRGQEALASRKSTGRPPKLTPAQHRRLMKIIIGKNPQQMNFGPELWTVRLVTELIEKLFGVVMHSVTVIRLLHGLGLTPQKPVKRAFRRDDDECRRWAREVFPSIVRESRKRQSTLLFADETGVHEDGPIGQTWGERGKTPVVRVVGTRRRTNVISAISPRGRLWFRCYGGTLTAPRFLEFLKALLHDLRKPVDLIIDSHPSHVAKMVLKWAEENRHRIRIHFMPGYAPDLNPDEHVWTHLKGLFRRDPVHLDEDFADAVRVSMEEIKNDRGLVQAFFKHPAVAYIREALGW
jgi:transposase